MLKNRRINIFGGPCAGKSTIASYLFAELKIKHYNVQFVEEYIKRWAYERRPPVSFDQIFLLAQQIHLEDIYLRNGVDFIITDCPLLVVYGFCLKNKLPFAEEVRRIAQHFENAYPSMNIFLDRKGLEYQEKGRYERYEEALEIDDLMEGILIEERLDYWKVQSKEKEKILQKILDHRSATSTISS